MPATAASSTRCPAPVPRTRLGIRRRRPLLGTLGSLVAATAAAFAATVGGGVSAASASTHDWIATGWNIHLANQLDPATTGHFFELALVVGSKSWLNSLPPDMRKIVMDGAQNMAATARRTSRSSQATARAFMVGRGVEVNDVARPEVAKMRAAVAPVYDWARQQWGEAYVNQVVKAAGN